jgi:SAM-dependent methyltransferase
MTAPPNPALKLALKAVAARNGGALNGLRIADQGCGKLRHYRALAPLARELYLVDTDKQLTTPHVDRQRTFTIEEFAAKEREKRFLEVQVLRDREFERSALGLDCVFSIAVFDVVPPDVRLSVIAAARRNLKRGGWFVVIIPRNDSSILARCTQENQHRDGHLFSHHGIQTFYRNFRDTDSVVKWCQARGLQLIEDLSLYRQACILFAKT